MGSNKATRKVDFPSDARSITFMIAMLTFPDISPDIFSITLFGLTLTLRWYALAYIVGILIGWRISLRAVRTPSLWQNQQPVMQGKQVEDLLSWVILGVIAGGRLVTSCFTGMRITWPSHCAFLRCGKAGCPFTAVPSG